MSKGLTFDEDNTEKNYKATHKAKITLDGIDVTRSFEEKITHNTDGTTTVEWSCSNLKGINKKADDTSENAEKLPVTENSKVVVTYSAKLNDSAVIGAAGNPNTVNLTYSNNPNKGGEGDTGKTPDDENIVFTYKAVVNKVDQDSKPLKGAKFDLLKKALDENGNEVWNDVATGIEAKEVKDESDNVVSYTAEYKGLDDGTYKIHESTTPEGYNTAEDIVFTITARHDETSNDPKLTSFSVDNPTKLTANDKTGTVSTNVVNQKGSTLPSTGGMGTTLLYVAGGILVACAAAYVVLNKKRA